VRGLSIFNNLNHDILARRALIRTLVVIRLVRLNSSNPRLCATLYALGKFEFWSDNKRGFAHCGAPSLDAGGSAMVSQSPTSVRQSWVGDKIRLAPVLQESRGRKFAWKLFSYARSDSPSLAHGSPRNRDCGCSAEWLPRWSKTTADLWVLAGGGGCGQNDPVAVVAHIVIVIRPKKPPRLLLARTRVRLSLGIKHPCLARRAYPKAGFSISAHP
jgi:hypothetical protein